MAAWHALHPTGACTDLANASPSTCSESVSPFGKLFVSPCCPWHARHSASLAAACAAASIRMANTAATCIGLASHHRPCLRISRFPDFDFDQLPGRHRHQPGAHERYGEDEREADEGRGEEEARVLEPSGDSGSLF